MKAILLFIIPIRNGNPAFLSSIYLHNHSFPKKSFGKLFPFGILSMLVASLGFSQGGDEQKRLFIVPKVNVYTTSKVLLNTDFRAFACFGEIELHLKKYAPFSFVIPLNFSDYTLRNSISSFNTTNYGWHIGFCPKVYLFNPFQKRQDCAGLGLSAGPLWYFLKFRTDSTNPPLDVNALSTSLTAAATFQFVFWKRLTIEPELFGEWLFRQRANGQVFKLNKVTLHPILNLGFMFKL